MAAASDTQARRASAVFEMILKVALTVTLLGILVLTFLDVVGRYVFNAPIPGAFEVQQYGMGILIFAGLPLVTFHRGHITVSLIDGVFARHATLKRVQGGVLNLISAGILALVTYCLWDQAEKAMQWGVTSAFLELPQYPVMFFMAFMGAVTCVVLLLHAVIDILGLEADGQRGKAGGGWEL